MGPTWLLPAPDGPHAGPINLAIRGHLAGSTIAPPTAGIGLHCWQWLWYPPQESWRNLVASPTSKHLSKHFDGLVQDCSNSSTLAMELLQSGTKPLKCPTQQKYIDSPVDRSLALFQTTLTCWVLNKHHYSCRQHFEQHFLKNITMKSANRQYFWKHFLRLYLYTDKDFMDGY